MSKIRLRYRDYEIEVEGTDEFIQKQLEDFHNQLEILGAKPISAAIKEEILGKPKKKKPTRVPAPAEFYRSKGKTDGISKVIIFAKYLEEYRGTAEFTRADVNKVVREAKVAKDIHAQYFTNAVKQGLLRKHSGGRYSLTLSAEEVLASM